MKMISLNESFSMNYNKFETCLYTLIQTKNKYYKINHRMKNLRPPSNSNSAIPFKSEIPSKLEISSKSKISSNSNSGIKYNSNSNIGSNSGLYYDPPEGDNNNQTPLGMN